MLKGVPAMEVLFLILTTHMKKATKYEAGTFTLVPNKESIRGMDPQIQSLYMWLCSYANTRGECFPSITTLASDTGCRVSTVKRSLGLLIKTGLLKKINRKGEEGLNLTNLYQLMTIPLPNEGGGVGPHRTGTSPHRTEGGSTQDGGVGPHRTEGGSTQDYITRYNETQSTFNSIHLTQGNSPTKGSAQPLVNDLIDLFKLVNENSAKFFKWQNQRTAAAALLTRHSFDDVKKMVEYCATHNSDAYFPIVMSPTDLETKWSKIEVIMKRPTANQSPNFIAGKEGKYANLPSLKLDPTNPKHKK